MRSHPPPPTRYSFLKRKKVTYVYTGLKFLLPQFIGIKRFICDYVSQTHHFSINSASSQVYALERLALFEMLTITTAEDRSFRVAIL